MRRFVRTFVILALAAATSACRGTGGGPLPAAGPASAPAAERAAQRPFSGAAFVAIGPTHMSDGVATSGKVNAFAVDPSDPHTMYVASGRGTGLETYSSAGIYRTTNGGRSWAAIDNGLTDPSGAISSVINALWIDPANPLVLMASSEYDGLFRSTNGGTSWRNVYRTTRATEFAFNGGVLYAATAAGILASSDDGASWTVALASTSRQSPTALASVEPSTGGSVTYAGMSDGTIYSLDGSTWKRQGKLPFNPSTGTAGSTAAVHQIAIDPQLPSTVYVSSNDGSWDQNLFVSTDSGLTWTAVLKNVYSNLGLGTQAIAFSLVHPHRVYLGEDGGFYYFTGDGSASPAYANAANLSVIDIRNIWPVANGSDDACWIASDQGLDYEPTCSLHVRGHFNDTVLSSSVATGLARRFTVSPDDRTLMVSLQDFNSHYTTNGGRTWTVTNYLYEDGFNELSPANARTCYGYDESVGFSFSTDGCQHYSYIGYKKGLFPSRLMTTPLAFDPANPNKIYLAALASYKGQKSGVFVTRNNGLSFGNLGWPFGAPGMIVFDPKNDKHILVGNLSNSGSTISVTFDGGSTWALSTGVPATAFWYDSSFSPGDSNLVLATSVDRASNVFVLRSTNGGRSFRRIVNVVNAPLIRGRRAIEGHEREDEDAARQGGPPPAYIYSPARQIRFNQQATTGTPYAVLTTLRGAYLSTDLGSTWHRLDGGLIAHSFWGIRWNHGYLYLGSDGQGVVKSTAAVQP